MARRATQARLDAAAYLTAVERARLQHMFDRREPPLSAETLATTTDATFRYMVLAALDRSQSDQLDLLAQVVDQVQARHQYRPPPVNRESTPESPFVTTFSDSSSPSPI
jgi:type II secretory pathway pseudopilin PulG